MTGPDHSAAGRRLSVGILVFDEVEVLDFAGPYEVFSRTRLISGVESRRSEASAPFDVFTVSAGELAVVATGGLRITADVGLEDAPSIDILLVPGGFGTRSLLDDERLIAWIRERASAARCVTSVCTGALLLASAGLLTGKRATTHWGALDLLADIDPSIRVVRGVRVVEDDIVSSAGVSAGIDMALAVVERLHGHDVAAETAHYMEYRRN